jgi:hypothetical protein
VRNHELNYLKSTLRRRYLSSNTSPRHLIIKPTVPIKEDWNVTSAGMLSWEGMRTRGDVPYLQNGDDLKVPHNWLIKVSAV